MPKPATQLEFLALCFELPDLSDASTPLPEWLPNDPCGHIHWPGWSLMD